MRHIGLDVLRFVAVFLVLGRHLHLPNDESLLDNLLSIWQCGGWVGVDVFFVLSGFLVSSLLMKEHAKNGSADLMRFLIRRGFKIYPAFWMLLLFTICVRFMQGRMPPAETLLGEILFVQNYLGGVWNHTWSLAVEEHFYLGLALLFALLSPKPNCQTTAIPSSKPKAAEQLKWIPRVFVLLASLCLILRCLTWYGLPDYQLATHLFPSHLRIDSLFFGVLIAYGCEFHQLEKKLAAISTRQITLSGMLLLSPAFLFSIEAHPAMAAFGVIAFYLGGGCLLMASLRLKTTSSCVLAFVAQIGGASYSIYLWHMVVNSWIYLSLAKWTNNYGYGFYLLVYLVGSLGFGWYFNRMIEAPVLYLRERMFPSKTQPNAALAQSG